MEDINLNKILEREDTYNRIRQTLLDLKNSNQEQKKGIYVYGNPGSGKTRFVKDVLNNLDFDIIHFDTGDVRNKNAIDNITNSNVSATNIISMFYKKKRKIAVLMDEIDGMNNGDKGGINTLIKLIRPKKTKKQKKENKTSNPVICISNYHVDKKIKELMKVCICFELKSPTNTQMGKIVQILMPNIDKHLEENIINYLQRDLRKLDSMLKIYNTNDNMLSKGICQYIFNKKSYNEDTKMITQKVLSQRYFFDDHLTIMNETDRTTVGLLFHENIVDYISQLEKTKGLQLYYRILNNICFGDYIDRITFQRQIWQFNEMTSLLKIIYNNKLFHENRIKKVKHKTELRFTKILTKYSTEYNNTVFIQTLCQTLGLDKKDMYFFFMNLKSNININDTELYSLMESYNISRLDVDRIYRFMDTFI